VAVLSATHLKTIQNYDFYRTDCFPGRKGRTAVAVRKCILHNHVHLPPLVSTEATRLCIPIGNSEVLLAAVYKSPGQAWNDADIFELLRFRQESILAGHLYAKYPFRNRVVSKPSSAKLLNLLHINEL
jgi:hypothetical protein